MCSFLSTRVLLCVASLRFQPLKIRAIASCACTSACDAPVLLDVAVCIRSWPLHLTSFCVCSSRRADTSASSFSFFACSASAMLTRWWRCCFRQALRCPNSATVALLTTSTVCRTHKQVPHETQDTTSGNQHCSTSFTSTKCTGRQMNYI